MPEVVDHLHVGLKIEVFFKTVEKTDRDRSVTTCQVSTDMGVCGACNSVVRAEDQSMTLNNLVFHWDCLRCYKCGRSFGGNRNCIVQDGVRGRRAGLVARSDVPGCPC